MRLEEDREGDIFVTFCHAGKKQVGSYVILARQNSGDIDIGMADIKSQQANNINLSLNHVIEPSTFFNEPQNSF